MTLLEIQLDNCKNTIGENNLLIKKNEELYDSLIQFKRAITNSQESFINTTTEKNKKLSDFDIEITNCRTMVEYSKGMSKVLNKVGIKCVNLTYSALLLSIDVKLSEYLNKIRECELSNQELGKTVDELKCRITEERNGK